MNTNALNGKRFSRWIVTAVPQGRYADCLCDCGNRRAVYVYSLLRGASKSCGCLNAESVKTVNVTHGMSGSTEFRIWRAMKTRCSNPNQPRWDIYGGRGIRVCGKWQNDFAAFYADVGPRPSIKHTIDRIDNDGHYEPGNVRWSTYREQRINQRRMHVTSCLGCSSKGRQRC